MMEEAKQDRADTRKMIESKVGGLEEKVDAVAGTVKGLASKADKHEGALADLQERVTIMETELQEMRNKKESPSFKEVTSGEVVTRLPEAGMAEAVGPPRAPMEPRAPGPTAASGGQRPAGEKERIKELFREANSTLTFSPVAEEDWRQVTTQLVEEEDMNQREAEKEAFYRMVEEYLAQEMMMKEEHIHDVMSQVEYVRPKGRNDWNALVVRFVDADIVDWILRGRGKMRQGVEGPNKPVVENWVPGGLYRRYSALRSVAYRLRQRDGLKTKINFGSNDFSLVTRKDRRDPWSAPVSLEMENLPDFQLSEVAATLAREQRSPTMAPGRARYGGTAPRTGKRLRVASPGLSPNGKEARVDEVRREQLRDGEGEGIDNNLDMNVTVRKQKILN